MNVLYYTCYADPWIKVAEILKYTHILTSGYWLNVIFLTDKTERDKFLAFSNSNKVMTRPVWQLMHKLPMFSNCQTDDLLNSVWFEERIVNLPSSVNVKMDNNL